MSSLTLPYWSRGIYGLSPRGFCHATNDAPENPLRLSVKSLSYLCVLLNVFESPPAGNSLWVAGSRSLQLCLQELRAQQPFPGALPPGAPCKAGVSHEAWGGSPDCMPTQCSPLVITWLLSNKKMVRSCQGKGRRVLDAAGKSPEGTSEEGWVCPRGVPWLRAQDYTCLLGPTDSSGFLPAPRWDT